MLADGGNSNHLLLCGLVCRLRLVRDMSKKIAIAGVPRAGKTTLGTLIADSIGAELRSTDDLIDLGWSEASQAASEMFNEDASFVMEGVAVPRALRKWLRANPEGKPVDEIRWMGTPRVEHTKGQAAMGKGVLKVWLEILPELQRRGVKISGFEDDATL